jgi:hypothetical protein
MYRLGMEELADKIFINSKENMEYALKRVGDLISRCDKFDTLVIKFLKSIETTIKWDEPHPDIGSVVEVLYTHLIKEGINEERYKELAEQLIVSVEASLGKYAGRDFTTAVKILTQYQVLGANEILDVLQKETKDAELLSKLGRLREKVRAFSERFRVNGFTFGEFEEVKQLLKGNDKLGREGFYDDALRFGFDYHKTSQELEKKGLLWIEEDLPKMRAAALKLSKVLRCEADAESVSKILKSRANVDPKEALNITQKVRPVIQALVSESIVGINPKYETTVMETPPYLSAIIPSAAAQDFDTLTDHPTQRYFLTTDPKRAPPEGFADLLNTLVHEEYGHCVHFSNTSTQYAAKARLVELLPSLHGGTTSEGLAFQRELEFLDALKRLGKKKQHEYTLAERNFIELVLPFGGFEEVLLEMEFTTYKQRIIRFLRVIGDARINSGRQDLLAFLEWAEKKTTLSQRTVFYQIFPAHEGIFPGYATCYAVVGQEIREIQRPFKDDPKKMVKFNAYASSMGYPARSIYISRLKQFAETLVAKKKARRTSLRSKRKKASSLRRKPGKARKN